MREQILLMTRPLGVAKTFVARIDSELMAGVRVIYAPLIQIVPLAACPDLSGFAGVLFTSGNGVDVAQQGSGNPAFCVGARTAALARAKGYDVRLSALDADDLVRQMTALRPQGPLLHLAGQHRRGRIAERLNDAGMSVSVHAGYDQQAQKLSPEAQEALSGEVPVILPLFSPRTAAHLDQQINGPAPATVIALSAAVKASLDPARFVQVVVADYPMGKDMVRCIEKQLRKNRLS